MNNKTTTMEVRQKLNLSSCYELWSLKHNKCWKNVMSMKKQSSDILFGLYKTLTLEIEEASKCVKYNEERINEIICYLNQIHTKDDENYNIFSPRKIESKFKYQIEESTKERDECESKVKYYESRIAELKEYVYQIERILKIENIK